MFSLGTFDKNNDLETRHLNGEISGKQFYGGMAVNSGAALASVAAGAGTGALVAKGLGAGATSIAGGMAVGGASGLAASTTEVLGTRAGYGAAGIEYKDTVGQDLTKIGIATAGGAVFGGIANGMGGKFEAAPETSSPGARTGPHGVDPNHHNANVTVRDAGGNIVSHKRVVSGNMIAAEKALGFPKNTLASHTEARAVKNTPLENGQSMTITGQKPPCPTCKGAMNRKAAETGSDIRYQWREDGRTQRWQAESGD